MEMLKEAKKHFEEHMASNIKGNNKSFFKYDRSRKPVREAVVPLNGKGKKGEIKGVLNLREFK